MQVTLSWLDYLILLTYTGFVVGIGFALKKYMKSSSDFLTSGRSLPTWVTGLAFSPTAMALTVANILRRILSLRNSPNEVPGLFHNAGI